MAPDPRFWRCVIKAVCLALQTYIDLFEALEGINWATFIIGMVSIVILVVNNELIKVKLSQMFPSTYHHHMFVGDSLFFCWNDDVGYYCFVVVVVHDGGSHLDRKNP